MSVEEVDRLRTLHGHTGGTAAQAFEQHGNANKSQLPIKFGQGSLQGSGAGPATKRLRPQSEIKVDFADIDDILEQCAVAPP